MERSGMHKRTKIRIVNWNVCITLNVSAALVDFAIIIYPRIEGK